MNDLDWWDLILYLAMADKDDLSPHVQALIKSIRTWRNGMLDQRSIHMDLSAVYSSWDEVVICFEKVEWERKS